MSGASRLTPAQLAAAVERDRDGRPDKTAMTNAERREAGLMTRLQAAAHEHLISLPCPRLAERCKGPVPDDIWAARLPGDPPEYVPGDPDAENWASLFASERDEAMA
jgi:hypothetical protein